MLSQRRLEAYRRMTPAQRWAETRALMNFAWASLLTLPREERERRLAIAAGKVRPPRRRRRRRRK